MQARSGGALRREAFVFGGGVFAAGALLWVALAAQPDAGAVGELERIRATREAAQAVEQAWRDLLAAPEPPVPPAGAPLEVGRTPRELRDPARCEGEAAAVVRTLLDSARRRGADRYQLEDAIELARDAVRKAPGEECALDARLLLVQLVSRTDDAARVALELEELHAGLPWDAALDGASPRPRAWLSVLPHLDADGRARARADLLDNAGWLLASGLDEDRLALENGAVTLVLDPRTAALVELLDEELPGIASDLRESEAWAGRRRLAAGALPFGTSDRWSLVPFEPLPLCVRLGQAPRFTHAHEVEAALAAAVLLPAGFALDFGRADEPEGEPLGPPLELAPGVVTCSLVHAAPDRLAASARARQRGIRLSLVGLATAVFLLGAVSAFALARERRLIALQRSFVAGVSHDLRTPLASVLLMAENLEAGRVKPERAAQYHTLIRREAERLRRRVDDILDFARVDRGELARVAREDVDPRALAEELCATLGTRAREAGIALECRTAGLDGHVRVDPDAVRRAVSNLFENAVRHSEAGRIELELDSPEGLALRLRLRDDGRGIPAHVANRVFEPFERGRAAERDPKGGTGLGLAIVRALARAHGGEARAIDGLDGRGVGFEVTFGLGEDGEQ